jgi:hypothetical protein
MLRPDNLQIIALVYHQGTYSLYIKVFRIIYKDIKEIQMQATTLTDLFLCGEQLDIWFSPQFVQNFIS